jgi:hypothetical protein
MPLICTMQLNDCANLQLNSFLRTFYVVKSPVYVVGFGQAWRVKVKCNSMFFLGSRGFVFLVYAHKNKAPSKP